MVGIGQVLSCFSIIRMKLKTQGAEEMGALTQQLSQPFLETSFQRAELVQMEETLASILIRAYGFAHGDSASTAMKEDNAVIRALARRMSCEKFYSRSLRTLVHSLRPAEEITSTAVRFLVLRVASCLNVTINAVIRNLADDR